LREHAEETGFNRGRLAAGAKEEATRVLHQRCAGLDVHKRTVTACVTTPAGKAVEQFGSTTR
jgi:hypothetical protein